MTRNEELALRATELAERIQGIRAALKRGNLTSAECKELEVEQVLSLAEAELKRLQSQ
jgi:hypothetical protein